MLTFFKDWIFKLLPGDYFDAQDTYKDLAGEGIVKRYLRNFGQELDAEFYPYIANFLDLFDAAKCDVSLLNNMSFILGLPPGIDNTEATYRKVLQYAVQIYKIKGTDDSFEMLFNFIGLDITIIEDMPGKAITYDASPPFNYDDIPPETYDEGCAACSGYTIAYASNGTPLNPDTVDPALLVIAQNIICFLQPINATFDGFIKRVVISETMPIQLTEDSSLENFVPVPHSYSDAFDESYE